MFLLTHVTAVCRGDWAEIVRRAPPSEPSYQGKAVAKTPSAMSKIRHPVRSFDSFCLGRRAVASLACDPNEYVGSIDSSLLMGTRYRARQSTRTYRAVK